MILVGSVRCCNVNTSMLWAHRSSTKSRAIRVWSRQLRNRFKIGCSVITPRRSSQRSFGMRYPRRDCYPPSRNSLPMKHTNRYPRHGLKSSHRMSMSFCQKRTILWNARPNSSSRLSKTTSKRSGSRACIIIEKQPYLRATTSKRFTTWR